MGHHEYVKDLIFGSPRYLDCGSPPEGIAYDHLIAIAGHVNSQLGRVCCCKQLMKVHLPYLDLPRVFIERGWPRVCPASPLLGMCRFQYPDLATC